VDKIKRLEDPVIHAPRKVNRIRQRKGLTLAPETVGALERVISRGNANNLSRAIDVAVQFFEQNQGAIPVRLQKTMGQSFLRKCIRSKKMPHEVLSMLAANWISDSEK
jgi:hypothetical protein